ncbi:MAG: diguanylate cyclase [Anaerolineaceae bacterium]|nr:diguanylate cyclase [Anaerolineaceae bacterium]
MAFRNYFRSIQKSWRIIVIITLIAWAISLGISYTTIPKFRSSATFLIYPNPNLTSSRDVMDSLDTLEGQKTTTTYSRIFTSERIKQDTVLKLGREPGTFDEYVVSTDSTDSNILILQVDGPDPQLAAELANNIGQNAIEYIKGIYQIFVISFLDTATIPETAFEPKPWRDGAYAAGIGFLMGIIVVMLQAQLSIPLKAIRERSITDKISTAFTKGHFRRLLENEMQKDDTKPVSLAIIDLEGIEGLEDVLSESMMKSLMTRITDLLKKQLYGTDVIGKWAASSYAILLPSTPLAPATRTMERINQVLSEAVEIEAYREKVELLPSIGLATRKPGLTVNQLIEEAETALHQARQSENKTIAHSDER